MKLFTWSVIVSGVFFFLAVGLSTQQSAAEFIQVELT